MQSIGVNAHRLSKNVTLYLTEASTVLQNETSQNHKPLMLMLPWLGSRSQAVDKYCQIYFRTGFDVLVVESEVRATPANVCLPCINDLSFQAIWIFLEVEIYFVQLCTLSRV